MASRGEINQPAALPEPDPRELAVLFLAFRRHLRLSIWIILGCLVLAALSLLLPKIYTADAALAYDPQIPLPKGGGSLASTDAQRDADLDAQLAEVATLPVAEDVARAVDLSANPRLQQEADNRAVGSGRKLSRDEALGTALLDHVKARRVGQTAEFTISYTAGTADQAARIANLFAASYLKTALQQKAALAQGSTDQLAARVAALRQQATSADSDLAAFRLANHLLEAPDSTALDQVVATLRGQLADARGQAAQASVRGASADGATVVGGGFGGSVDTTPVSALTQQRAATAADLSALLSRYGEKHPDVIAAREKLRGMDAELAQAMHGNRASAMAEAHAVAARAQALSGSLREAEARVAATLASQAQLLDLQNTALAARLAYQDALKLSADQAAQRALIQPDAQQVGLAMPPLRATFPRAGINLPAGLALGVVLAVVAAFIRESWFQTLGSEEDIARWLDADYLAALPRLTRPLRRARRDPVAAVLLHPRSPFAESFRRLGASALSAAGHGSTRGGGARIIGVTSALPGEGRTTASIAMGRALAAAGMKVALVDGGAAGNPRGGSKIAALIGAPDGSGGPGLDSSGLAVFAQGNGTDLALRDGPPAQSITAMRGDYDLVIIDLGAILSECASRELLESLDALILVARWRATPVRTIREAMRRIAAAGGHVSGVALAMVEGTRRDRLG